MDDAFNSGVFARFLLQSPQTELPNHLHMKNQQSTSKEIGEFLMNWWKRVYVKMEKSERICEILDWIWKNDSWLSISVTIISLYLTLIQNLISIRQIRMISVMHIFMTLAKMPFFLCSQCNSVKSVQASSKCHFGCVWKGPMCKFHVIHKITISHQKC